MFCKHYKAYLKEREGLEVIDHKHGFIIWRMFERQGDKIGFINDYWVMPEQRRKGLGFKLADQAILKMKKKGAKVVLCQSDERANGHELSRKTILNYGFQEVEKDGSIIHYALEV